MNDQQRRIKLAEAMGAKCVDGIWHWKGSTWNELLFDPFTDANDDYAVLEWMRSQPKEMKWEYMDHYFAGRLARNELDHTLPVYQIGDYARAALKVIEDE